MFSQYKLESGLILTINQAWVKKLLKAEAKLQKPILQELISEKNADTKPPHINSNSSPSKKISTVKYKDRIEKRYWTTKLGHDKLFIREERDPKSYLIKKNEFKDSIRQSKYTKVPEYILKIECPKKFLRITISRKIFGTQIKTPSRQIKKVNEITKITRELSHKDLLPAILRPSHFLFTKKGIYLVDNSIGFPPINRNKIVLLEVIQKTKTSFNWNTTNNLKTFETAINQLPNKTKQRIKKIRLRNLLEEIRYGEKNSTDFEQEISQKTATLFKKYKKNKKTKTKKFIPISTNTYLSKACKPK